MPALIASVPTNGIHMPATLVGAADAARSSDTCEPMACGWNDVCAELAEIPPRSA